MHYQEIINITEKHWTVGSNNPTSNELQEVTAKTIMRHS
jgi:hypothetical protein